MLVTKQDISLKQRGEIYQCCVTPVLLYFCETWELTVVDQSSLRRIGSSYDQDDLWGEIG